MNIYLEYKDEKSAKFWKIEINNDTHTVTYGKIGTDGQSKTKTFESVEKATKEAEKLIKAKTKKGYQEVGTKEESANDKAGNPSIDITYIEEDEARERFDLDQYDPLGSIAYDTILLIEGDLIVENDLVDNAIHSIFFNNERTTTGELIIITGNLRVKGNIKLYAESGYPCFLVLKDLYCDVLYSFDNIIQVKGDAHIKYFYYGSYNHGVMAVEGTTYVPYLINSDHHSDLQPSKETILINKYHDEDDFFIYDYYPEDFGRIFIEEVVYFYDEAFELDLDLFLNTLKAGQSPFKKEAKPSRELFTEEIEKMAKEGTIKTLNLTDKKLIEIPPALFEIKRLEVLILDETHLTSLETLDQLIQSKKELNVKKTIVELLYDSPFLLSEAIGKLTNLKELSLNKTKIVALPESISELSQLKSLNLTYCYSFAKLPLSIGNLEALEILNLAHCYQLTVLPESIHQLRNLKVLNLGYCNQLKKLPESIGQLQNLEVLNLGNCRQLEYLPESIGQLKKLKKLVLSNFQGEIPDALFDLPQIEELEILT
jgi:predicted DNA-binding WGR domain protein